MTFFNINALLWIMIMLIGNPLMFYFNNNHFDVIIKVLKQNFIKIIILNFKELKAYIKQSI